MVALDATDGLHTEIEETLLHLGAVTGVIPAQEITLAPVRQEVDLPRACGPRADRGQSLLDNR